MLITGVDDTGEGKRENILRQEVYSYFVETMLGCCLHPVKDFLLYVQFEADVFATVSKI